jgi:hypothetical protein
MPAHANHMRLKTARPRPPDARTVRPRLLAAGADALLQRPERHLSRPQRRADGRQLGVRLDALPPQRGRQGEAVEAVGPRERELGAGGAALAAAQGAVDLGVGFSGFVLECGELTNEASSS